MYFYGRASSIGPNEVGEIITFVESPRAFAVTKRSGFPEAGAAPAPLLAVGCIIPTYALLVSCLGNSSRKTRYRRPLSGGPRCPAGHHPSADQPRALERRGLVRVCRLPAKRWCRCGRKRRDARDFCHRCRRHGLRLAPRRGRRAQCGAGGEPAQGCPGAWRAGYGARWRTHHRRRVGGLRRRAARHDRHEPRAEGGCGGAHGAHRGRDLLARPGRGTAPLRAGLPFGTAQHDLLRGGHPGRRRHRRKLRAPRLQRRPGDRPAGGDADWRHRRMLG